MKFNRKEILMPVRKWKEPKGADYAKNGSYSCKSFNVEKTWYAVVCVKNELKLIASVWVGVKHNYGGSTARCTFSGIKGSGSAKYRYCQMDGVSSVIDKAMQVAGVKFKSYTPGTSEVRYTLLEYIRKCGFRGQALIVGG